MVAQVATQKQATEQAQRATEDAKRDALLQAKKQAAEETLRSAQEERNRLEQDRKLLEVEKQAADAAKKQAASQRAAPVAPKSAAQYDGTYGGRLCNNPKNNAKLFCWPVDLVVGNGIVEGSWIGFSKKTAKANGTVAANGALELKLAAWTREGNPIYTVLAGRVSVDASTASGQWRNGTEIAGDWKRTR